MWALLRALMGLKWDEKLGLSYLRVSKLGTGEKAGGYFRRNARTILELFAHITDDRTFFHTSVA